MPKPHWGTGHDDQHLGQAIPGGNIENCGQAKDWAHRHRWLQQKEYLATITSPGDNHFVGHHSNISGAIPTRAWLGGRDHGREGPWTWSTGPEQGQQILGQHGGGQGNQTTEKEKEMSWRYLMDALVSTGITTSGEIIWPKQQNGTRRGQNIQSTQSPALQGQKGGHPHKFESILPEKFKITVET